MMMMTLHGVWILGCLAVAGAVPSYVAPKVGVAFESQEVAVHSLMDAYTTLVYHIPKTIPKHNTTGCGWVDIQKDYKLLSSPLWDLLRGYESLTVTKMCEDSPLVCGHLPADTPHTKSPRRPKRFIGALGALAGFAGIGLAVRNNVRISEMTEALNTVKENQKKVASFIDNSEANTKYELHKLERLIIARSEETRQRIDKINKEICKFNIHYASAFLQMSSRMMIDEAYVVVERAQGGQMDPRMIPLSAINDMASPGGPLESSIYADDPGLFYSLTSPYLVGMDQEKGLLYYLLQTPKISRHDISPIYRVFNYGYQDPASASSYKLQLPDHFYMLSDPASKTDYPSLPVPIDPTRCVNKGSFLMCRHEVPEITNRSSCLQALVHNLPTQSCSISKVEKGVAKVLHATRTAVLVRGEPVAELTDLVQGIPSTRRMTLDTLALTSIPYRNFSVLSVSGHTIMSPHSPKATKQADLVGVDAMGLIQLPFTPDQLSDDSSLSRDSDGLMVSWGNRNKLASQLEDITLTHSVAAWGVSITAVGVLVALSTLVYTLSTKKWKQMRVRRHLEGVWAQVPMSPPKTPRLPQIMDPQVEVPL